MEAIRVGANLDDKKFDLRLHLVAGKRGLSRRVSSARIQKPGLALAGFVEYLRKERIQVFGNTEMSYLKTLPRERGIEVLRNFFAQDVACLVVTKNIEIPPEVAALADRAIRDSSPRNARPAPLLAPKVRVLQRPHIRARRV